MERKFLEINLNKLYSPEKPDLSEWVTYKGRLAEQLPDNTNLRETIVLLTGTAPIWLLRKSTEFLWMIVRYVCRETKDKRLSVATSVSANSIVYKSFRDREKFWESLENKNSI